MIAQVSGQMLEKSPTWCVIDCHGIGIGMHISLNTYQQLERIGKGEKAVLLTHLHVREDALQLFGFSAGDERDLFRLLINVSGVGPRLALAILSGSSADELQLSIAREDIDSLTRIPGVGKKTAQRLVLELKEKLSLQMPASQAVAGLPANTPISKINEALMAMMALGFKQPIAKRAIDKVLQVQGEDVSVEDLIKGALKEL